MIFIQDYAFHVHTYVKRPGLINDPLHHIIEKWNQMFTLTRLMSCVWTISSTRAAVSCSGRLESPRANLQIKHTHILFQRKDFPQPQKFTETSYSLSLENTSQSLKVNLKISSDKWPKVKCIIHIIIVQKSTLNRIIKNTTIADIQYRWLLCSM